MRASGMVCSCGRISCAGCGRVKGSPWAMTTVMVARLVAEVLLEKPPPELLDLMPSLQQDVTGLRASSDQPDDRLGVLLVCSSVAPGAVSMLTW